jgi:hypothetical protein
MTCGHKGILFKHTADNAAEQLVLAVHSYDQNHPFHKQPMPIPASGSMRLSSAQLQEVPVFKMTHSLRGCSRAMFTRCLDQGPAWGCRTMAQCLLSIGGAASVHIAPDPATGNDRFRTVLLKLMEVN